MTKMAVSASGTPHPAGPYSQGIIANGLLFTAGFGPQDPNTGEVPTGVASQTAQVLLNIQALLREAGATMNDVVRSTVHLQHLKRDFDDFNNAYQKFFIEPYPVRTTVGSNLNDILVEINVVAVLPAR